MRTPEIHTRSEAIEQSLIKLIAGTMKLKDISITELSHTTGIERTGLGKMLRMKQAMTMKQFVTICIHLEILGEEIEKAFH